MKRALVWLLILWKRLFKKTGFLVILVLIPIMTFMLSSAAGDNGFINIAVAFEDRDDAASIDLMSRLTTKGSMIKYTVCDSPADAIEMAESGKTDSAWVFVRNLSKTAGSGQVLAKIYQREDNIFLKLTREKIFCTLMPEVAYNIYKEFTTEEMLPRVELTEEELRTAYDVYDTDEGLVEFQSPEGEVKAAPDYLVTPLRGMTAILMLMCGMAATMYFLTDEDKGSFCLLRLPGRFGVLLASNFCALATASVFVTVSFILTGSYTSFLTESAAMLGYIIISTLFCTLLGALVSHIKYFSLLLPAVLVVSLAFCPVFFGGNDMFLLRYPLPTYHYLYATADISRLWHMLIYAATALPLAYLIYIIRRKQTV